MLVFFCAFLLVFSFIASVAFAPMYSVLSLLLAYFLSGFFFVYLGLEFLGFVIILIYAGATVVLFVFVLMLTNQPSREFFFVKSSIRYYNIYLTGYAITFGLFLFFLIYYCGVTVSKKFDFVVYSTDLLCAQSDLVFISNCLYNFDFLLLITVSFLLFIVLIAVVIVTSNYKINYIKKRYVNVTLNSFVLFIFCSEVFDTTMMENFSYTHWFLENVAFGTTYFILFCSATGWITAFTYNFKELAFYMRIEFGGDGGGQPPTHYPLLNAALKNRKLDKNKGVFTAKNMGLIKLAYSCSNKAFLSLSEFENIREKRMILSLVHIYKNSIQLKKLFPSKYIFIEDSLEDIRKVFETERPLVTEILYQRNMDYLKEQMKLIESIRLERESIILRIAGFVLDQFIRLKNWYIKKVNEPIEQMSESDRKFWEIEKVYWVLVVVSFRFKKKIFLALTYFYHYLGLYIDDRLDELEVENQKKEDIRAKKENREPKKIDYSFLKFCIFIFFCFVTLTTLFYFFNSYE